MDILEVGTEWDSTDALKHACATYAVTHRFPTKTVKRNTNQFDIRCKHDGCTWRLYASKPRDGPKFVIKIFIDKHYNCPGAHLKNPAANSHFIANIIAAKVKEKLDYAPIEILQDIRCTHSVEVSYWQAHRAKQKAITDLNGTPEEGYAKLPQYCEKLLEANPGILSLIQLSD
jgi:zinc finger SWIM domain-containing protein 3